MGSSFSNWIGKLKFLYWRCGQTILNDLFVAWQKKKNKDPKITRDNETAKKDTSFISFSGEDSNTSNYL